MDRLYFEFEASRELNDDHSFLTAEDFQRGRWMLRLTSQPQGGLHRRRTRPLGDCRMHRTIDHPRKISLLYVGNMVLMNVSCS